MPAIAAFGLNADGSEGQIEIICDHQQVFQRHFLLLKPVIHGFSAKVHIGRRLQQNEMFVPLNL